MNVFKILSADVVFFNVTPKQLDGKYVVNSGVLIEYGMVQRQAASLVEIRSPRPFFRLFITRFPKHILPPLMNESDVFSFKKSTKGKIELRSTMIQMMTQAASEQRQSTRLTPAEGEKERISQEEI